LKISAIVLSRVLAFVDTVDLSPTAGINAPEFVREAAKQFHFLKYPEKLEEFDTTKGIEFLIGRIGRRTISKLVIWPNALVIETRSNTTEAKELLGEILLWGKEKFNLTYSPEMITRYAYVSDLSFYSEAPILSVSPLWERIARKTGEALSEMWKDTIHYEPIEFKIGHDPLARKWGIAPFQITRRAEHKFSENKYFSEAPLPTDLHIALLEEYEAGILALQGKTRV
jgi:hypothetical protein